MRKSIILVALFYGSWGQAQSPSGTAGTSGTSAVSATSQPASSQGTTTQNAAAESMPVTTTEAPASRRFHVLFTSDIYGRYAWPGCVERTKGRADLGHLAATANKLRKEAKAAGDAEPVLVAAGDMIRPDIMGNHLFAAGKALAPVAVELIKSAGFDAASLGGFDFGSSPEALQRYMALMKNAGIPLLASNIKCKKDDDFRCRSLGHDGKRYRIIERDGIKVALIGLVRQDLTKTILKRSVGSMSTTSPLAETKKLLKEVREKEGAHIVVLLANLNLESDAPLPVLKFVRALGDAGPDLVVANAMYESGNSNFLANIERGRGPMIVGTDRFGQHLGQVTFHLKKEDGKFVVDKKIATRHSTADSAPGQADAERAGKLLKEVCRAVDRPLAGAHFSKPMSRAEFMDYVKEIMRNDTNGEVSLLNQSAIADTGFPWRGKLKKEAILRAIRSETQVGSAWLSGKRLTKLLASHSSGSKGLTLLGLKKINKKWHINGRPLIGGQHYRVAMTAFIASGGDGLVKFSAAESFVPGGKNLRQLVIDHFLENRHADDGDTSVSLKADFPDPSNRWLLFGDLDFGFSINNVSVSNGGANPRYSTPPLTKDNVTALKGNLDLLVGATTKDHRIELEVGLGYGHAWTRSQAETESIEAESQDQIQAGLLYRLQLLRNKFGYGSWWVPEPFAEGILRTEFTPSGSYTEGGEDKEYHYMDLAGEVGIGFALHPLLFLKAGMVVRSELLTPAAAEAEHTGSPGIYLGYTLKRYKLINSPHHPLQIESRLDFTFTDLSDRLVREFTVKSKIYFALTRQIHLSATHQLYIYDDRNSHASISNDISFGIDLLLDYRYQTY
jgi:2',3'-cyclic-nucleotide 2'-phosphodiesterase (5'-nucleotidase family)